MGSRLRANQPVPKRMLPIRHLRQRLHLLCEPQERRRACHNFVERLFLRYSAPARRLRGGVCRQAWAGFEGKLCAFHACSDTHCVFDSQHSKARFLRYKAKPRCDIAPWFVGLDIHYRVEGSSGSPMWKGPVRTDEVAGVSIRVALQIILMLRFRLPECASRL